MVFIHIINQVQYPFIILFIKTPGSYVKSVLRYGLPPVFQTVVIIVLIVILTLDPSIRDKVRKLLVEYTLL